MKKFKAIALLLVLIVALSVTQFTAGATTYSQSDSDVIKIEGTTTRAAWCYNFIRHDNTTKTITGYDELGYHSTVYNFPMYGYMYTVYGNGSILDDTTRITTAAQNGYCAVKASNKYNFTQTIPAGKVVHYARLIGAFNETHGSYSKVSGYSDMYFNTLISPVGW